MTVWLNPVAFGLLAATLLPILVHLLLKRRSLPTLFPTVRFIVSSEQSAFRLHRPSDVTLLIVRVAIVGCAALAVARPLQLTDERREAWFHHTTRAVVVDTSASVNRERAVEAATVELGGATVTRRFDSRSLPEGIARASAWLARVEPGFREVVVISDFQLGVLTRADVAHVPVNIGIRPLPVDSTAAPGALVEAPPVIHEGRAFARSVSAGGDMTVVTLRPIGMPDGLEIQSTPVAGKLRQAVANAGATAPSPEQPIVIRFVDDLQARPGDRWPEGWMRDAGLRLLTAVADGVRLSTRDRALVIDADAPPDSLAAAQLVQAALNARYDSSAFADREPTQIAPTVLAAWTRKPSPPDAEAWRNTTDSDGRWLWLGAIILLTLETSLRRPRVHRPVQKEAHAA